MFVLVVFIMLFQIRPTFGVCLIAVWLLWRLNSILHHGSVIKRPNIRFIELPTRLGQALSSFLYLISGPKMLLRAYQGSGSPIALRTPEGYYIHISSTAHINELLGAPEGTFSLHALSKLMLQPRHTMNGLELSDDMGENGHIHLRIIGVVHRNKLDALEPALHHAVSSVLSNAISDEWTELPIFEFSKRVILVGNCLAFFGDKLASDPDFVEAALQYPEDLFKTAEALRLLPGFVAPWVAPVLMRHHQASKLLTQKLLDLIEERITEKSTPSKASDIIQLFIDGTRSRDGWTPTKIVQVILGIWFASIHQPAMSLAYALNDICREGQHLAALRHELGSVLPTNTNPPLGGIDSLPLLDAFLKESARLHPSDSISCRRKVLRPFKFTDGTTVASGEVVCVPMNAVLRDPANYYRSSEFDPGRFLAQGSKFSDATPEFPLWGLGRHACPGRHYASRILKIAMGLLLQEYDVRLPSGSEDGFKTLSWRSSVIPHPNAKMLFRRRKMVW